GEELRAPLRRVNLGQALDARRPACSRLEVCNGRHGVVPVDGGLLHAVRPDAPLPVSFALALPRLVRRQFEGDLGSPVASFSRLASLSGRRLPTHLSPLAARRREAVTRATSRPRRRAITDCLRPRCLCTP